MNAVEGSCGVSFWLLAVLLIAVGGCSSSRPAYTCTDSDGDGRGTGLACQGSDCNDADPQCWEGECCSSCTDLDGDGFGQGEGCQGPDCNDSDSNCHAGLCCIDCQDFDGDGFGEGADCQGTDCDDSDPNCHEGSCCSRCADSDGDGYGDGPDCLGPDCNDDDSSCHDGSCCDACPEGQVDCGNGCTDVTRDAENCGGCGIACDPGEQCSDSACLCPDADGDGFDTCDAAAAHDDGKPADCDDSDSSVNPVALEVCGNLSDEDCSGGLDDVDSDGDGFVAAADAAGNACGGDDCDDTDEAVNPAAIESCNLVDDDCDGATDEDTEQRCYDGPADTEGVGICRAGLMYCIDGEFSSCSGQVLPAPEACNGMDDDCDGNIDEDLPSLVCGLGACRTTVESCMDGAAQACPAQNTAGREECGNGVDDDCDGVVDEGCRCVYVAPNGDDANNGSADSPVRTIRRAFEIAGGIAGPRQICLGGSPGCSSGVVPNAIYRENVRMRDGISILGGFDPSNKWYQTPLTDPGPKCYTEIQVDVSEGVLFDEQIVNPTWLDNVVVTQHAKSGDTAAVTIWGSTGARVTRSVIIGNEVGTMTTGIAVLAASDGSPATPEIASCIVEGGSGEISVGVLSR
ncbi:MAG: hypothetical protein D6806_10000, partial [Deltaproteobacteria bacterium]